MTIYVTLTLSARTTVVSCSECGRRLLVIPGTPVLKVETVLEPSGRGIVTKCPRCRTLQEVRDAG